MSDNYQAVYDAVRSRFHQAAGEWSRPFVLLKPKLFPDGNMWCALYGENLQDGLAGFGTSPAKAAWAFDQAFYADMPEEKP